MLGSLSGRLVSVTTTVVEHDDVVGQQGGNENLLDGGLEALAVDRTVEDS